MAKLQLFFALVVVVSTEFGTVQSDQLITRISGGAAARVNYQVCLLRAPTRGLEFHCGGSIVSNYFVLTAAHCVAETRLLIRAGSLYCLRDGSLHTPKLIIKHRDYVGESNGYMHDIALIRVYQPLSGPNIAVLPLSRGNTPSNTYGTVSGWGSIYESPNLSEMPNVLQTAIIPIHSKEACQMYSKIYRQQYGIIHADKGQICAGNQTATACHGDSGGPLVYNGAQIGIVSNGYKYCGTLPNFFTEVSYYLSWIQQYLK